MNRIACPSCGHGLKYTDAQAGKKAKCPKCAAAIRIPHAATEPVSNPSKDPEDDGIKTGSTAEANKRSRVSPKDPHYVSLDASGSQFAVNWPQGRCLYCCGPGEGSMLEIATGSKTVGRITSVYSARLELPYCAKDLAKANRMRRIRDGLFAIPVTVGFLVGLVVFYTLYNEQPDWLISVVLTAFFWGAGGGFLVGLLSWLSLRAIAGRSECVMATFACLRRAIRYQS